MSKKSKTVGEVFETFTIEQKTAVYAIIGLVLESEDLASDNYKKGYINGIEQAIKIIDKRCHEADYYTCETLLSIRSDIEKLLGKESEDV